MVHGLRERIIGGALAAAPLIPPPSFPLKLAQQPWHGIQLLISAKDRLQWKQCHACMYIAGQAVQIQIHTLCGAECAERMTHTYTYICMAMAHPRWGSEQQD